MDAPQAIDTKGSDLGTEVRSFLIADLRGYTAFTQEQGDQAAGELAAWFARLARDEVNSRGGRVVELRGDEVLAVFPSARQALRAAVELQARCLREGLPLQVGMGLDAGEAVPVEDGYRGAAVNLAARLCSTAREGEVLASETMVHLARRVPGLEYIDRGTLQLKGFQEAVRAVQVVVESAERVPSPGTELTGTAASASGSMPVGGFLGALPEGKLVAREEEVDRMRTAVAAVAGGAGRLIMIGGEAGIGKTRLAQEATALAHDGGFLVAAGSCYQQRQAVPLYPFSEVLSGLYASSPQGLQRRAAREWPDLAGLLPELGPATLGWSAGTDEQERLFRAVFGFVAAVTQETSVCLALDDLQWADESSLELLRYLARQTRADRVLMIGTYRDDEMQRGGLLDGMLLELHRQQLAEIVRLQGLSRPGTAALIAETLGEGQVRDEVVELVYRRTDGNPFFVREVTRDLLERRALVRERGTWRLGSRGEAEVPGPVRAVVEGRLARLTASARTLLQEASVLGRTFSFDDLLAMTERPEAEIEGDLEVAIAAGLIRERGRDTYAFDHALLQETLYADLPSRRRRRLHLAAAAAIEARAGDRPEGRAAELAWHFLQGGEAERGLRFAVQAADEAAALFAHREAERLYRMALEIMREREPGGSPAVLETQVLEKLSDEVASLGRYDEAREYLERAVQLYQDARDLEGERRAVARIGSIEADAGEIDQGLARLRGLLASSGRRSGTIPSPGLALLYASLARLFTAGGLAAESLQAAELAVREAQAVHEDGILAEAEVRRGEALAMLGRHEEARRVLDGAVPLARSGNLTALMAATNTIGYTCVLAGAFEESRTYREQALQFAERLGDVRGMALVLVSLADSLYLLGDWVGAASLLQRAWDTAQAFDLTGVMPDVGLARASLAAERGEGDEADRLLRQVETTGREMGDESLSRRAQLGFAQRDLLAGHKEGAIERLSPMQLLAETEPTISVTFLSLLAQAYVDAGRWREAEELAVRLATTAATRHDRPAFSESLRLQGAIRAAEGRWDEAKRLLDGALTLVRAMPYPLQEGRILLEQGQVLAAKGELERSQGALEEAQQIFRRLGAQLYLHQADQRIQSWRRAKA